MQSAGLDFARLKLWFAEGGWTPIGIRSASYLGGLGDNVGAEGHLDAAGRRAANGHVKEDNGRGHGDKECCVIKAAGGMGRGLM